jgi:serine phosphatase RsbU (regulator of sigma subunit)
LPTRIIGSIIAITLNLLVKKNKLNVYTAKDLFSLYLLICMIFYNAYINLNSLSLYYTGFSMIVVIVFATFILSVRRIIMYSLTVIASLIIIFIISKHPLYTHFGLGAFTLLVELSIIALISYGFYEKYLSEIKSKILLKESRNNLEIKQKEILDSIHYAKRIQNALLANKTLIDENIPENFILFKPKDIVSGDFYWATNTISAEGHELFYLAVCDSTGHGVPGAFMSLLNIGFLSEAINEKKIHEPSEIFNMVRNRLIQSISKEGQKDGFDGILICFNKNTGIIKYSAAHNAPILIIDQEIKSLPYDKMPVGMGENIKSFLTYKVDASKGNMLYLYTDGYADQFGGPNGKKIKYKQLNNLLLDISNLDLYLQKEKLEDFFENWKGELEQVDDVCIIGIRL